MATDPITAPQTAQEETPASPASSRRQAFQAAVLDRALVVVVLALAFLLASFPARNSDLWIHLAAGRLLAEGRYRFGVDPFTYTTSDTYWVNHSWLFDLSLYHLAQAGGGADTAVGGAALVVFKALLATLLAAVLLAIRRRGQSMAAPAFCTLLALLALMPRLLLQPICVSLLFLGVTVYLLQRPRRSEARWSALWWLPPLFALWVNLDEWFFLGPVTVGLYLLGDWLQKVLPADDQPADQAGERRRLSLVLAVSLAACLLNPHGFRAFALPPEILASGRAADLRGDAVFQPLFYSPFQSAFWHPALGLNAAGLAYYLLAGLGLVSLALTRSSRRWWRLLVWLAFALLSVNQARVIPFFAVVAGPLTALNLQDYAAATEAPRRRRWPLAGRVLTLLAGLGLLVAVGPGWLHPSQGYPWLARRVAWEVVVDPSLRNAAEQLRAWRNQGLLPAGARGFNLHPDSANYCAWFCPGEQGFFDARSPLSSTAAAYAAVRQALNPQPDPVPPGMTPSPVTGWQHVFRDHGINHVVLTGIDADATMPAIRRLASDPNQWTLLYLDGRTTIFGWRDPQQPAAVDPFQTLRLDLQQRAFGPVPAATPSAGAGAQPSPRGWWGRYFAMPAPRPLAADEAAMYLQIHESLNQREQQLSLPRHAAAGGGTVAMAGNPVAMPGTLIYLMGWHEVLNSRGMPELPILAVRAARRAIASNPAQPEAYLALAQAYVSLWKVHEDQWARYRPPVLSMEAVLQGNYQAQGQPYRIRRDVPFRQFLRRAQIAACLQRALTLQPGNVEAQRVLANLFWEMSYFDLALEHSRAWWNQLLVRGPLPGESHEQFEQRLGQLAQRLEAWQQRFLQLNSEYEKRTGTASTIQKARAAFTSFGLVREALRLLRSLDPAQFEPSDLDLLLYLLTTTGQAEELRAALTPNLKPQLGFGYDWYRALQAADAGDYSEADVRLKDSLAHLQGQPNHIRAEFHFIRGLLALEAGHNQAAAQQFHQAVELGYLREERSAVLAAWSASSSLEALTVLALGSEGGLRKPLTLEAWPIASRYLEDLERWWRR